MSFYTYVTALQPPTAVHDAVKGSFLSANETNLIVSNETRIEIYTLEKNTLIPTLDFDVYCHIAKLYIINSTDQPLCSLFILSEQHTFHVVRYNPLTKTIVTEKNGVLKQQVGRRTDNVLSIKDPDNQFFVVSTFTGNLSIIPIQGRKATNKKGKVKDVGYNGQAFDSFNIEIQAFNIKSMIALDSSGAPMMAILNEDIDGMQIIFYQINLSTQHIDEINKLNTSLDPSTHYLIPMPQPFGGIIAIAEQSICYLTTKNTKVNIDTKSLNIISHEFISGSLSPQFILGDVSGTVYLLSTKFINTNVTELSLKKIYDEITCSTMVYLDFHLLYLGSAHGDSLLMKVHEKNGKLKLKKVDEYSNIGPITDFCIFDLDNQGKQTLVCCSGTNNHASLRIVQSGIGFIEKANIPISGVQRIWAISSSSSVQLSNQKINNNDIIILTTLEDTRIFHHSNKNSAHIQELDKYSMLDLSQRTLEIYHFEKNNSALQVTSDMVRFMESDINNTQLTTWTPSSSNNILIAVVKHHWCIVSCGFGTLYVIKVNTKNNQLLELKDVKLHNEISCMDIVYKKDEPSMLAVGLWGGNNVQLLGLPDLNVISEVKLQDSVPRSILYHHLHKEPYIFVSLGDGKVISYKVEDDHLIKSNEITLGTRSTSLHSISIQGEKVVLVASDRPTIINSSHHHLIYSAINLEEIKTITTFNNAKWKKSLMVVTENSILIGDLDHVRKLHYSKIPLNKKMGRRIQYHEHSQTIILGIEQVINDEVTDVNKKIGWIHLYDAKTFKEIGVYDLLENELVESICVTNIFNDGEQYIFVGTAIQTEDPNKQNGRILMYKINNNRSIQLIDSVDVPGVVYGIKPYLDSIVIAINGSIYYLSSFKKEAAEGEKITLKHKMGMNILVVDMDTREDSILVGDFMKSMSLLKMENNESNSNNYHSSSKLIRVANDYNANWMTAVKIVDKNTYIGADMYYNTFTLLSPDIKDDDKSLNEILRMDTVGEYHLGDMINRMKEGSLANEINEINKDKETWSLLYVTVNGSIGSMIGISEEDYYMLSALQVKLLDVLPPVGELDFIGWRTFDNETRKGEPRNFIDGNLVEKYLTLSLKQQQSIAHSLSCTTEELQITIERLSQL